MVTSIQLGNLFKNADGKYVVGGTGSGFDTETLIKDLTEARRLPAVQLEDRIASSTKVSEAFSELKDILGRFRDAANFLRNPPGVNNEIENSFKYRNATVTTSNGSVASNYLTVTVQPGVDVQTFDISNISSIATAKKQEIVGNFAIADADDQVVFAAPAGVQLGDGTISIRHIDGVSPDVNITFDDGDSLNEVAGKFNAVKSQTGIQATVVKVASNQFKLLFSATQTGTAYDFDMANPATITADPGGVFATVGFNTTQAVSDAQFTIDGVTVTRGSNSVSDVIDGVTFNLQQPTGGVTLDVGVQPDTAAVKGAILSFVDAYNEFKIFAARQQEVGTDGKPTEDALLFNNASLRSIISRVSAEMSTVVDGLTAGDPSRLSDIGITFFDFPGDEETPFTRNALTVDETTLEAALQSNFDAVRKVFEFDFSANNPDLTVFSRTNNLGVTNFQLVIDQTNDVYEAHYTDPVTLLPAVVNLEGTPLSGGSGGVVLKGPAGSVFDGLTMIFTDTIDTTIDVDVSQGVADRLFNSLEEVLDEDEGALEIELQSIEDAKVRYEEEIARIDEQIEAYRDQLLAKFSALEQAITQANAILQSLAANAAARENS